MNQNTFSRLARIPSVAGVLLLAFSFAPSAPLVAFEIEKTNGETFDAIRIEYSTGDPLRLETATGSISIPIANIRSFTADESAAGTLQEDLEELRAANSALTEKRDELQRILPVIAGIKKKTDALISVDTMKSEVAQAAIGEGADIINDISALRNDPEMLGLAIEKSAPVILMHMKGTPKTMQAKPYYDDVLSELHSFFEERIGHAIGNGLNREKIIIDPGIGFGKRLQDNLTLIRNLHSFGTLDQPILIGISRKSFIGKILGLPSKDRVEGSIAAAVISVLQGAHILRVHDVGAVKRAVHMAEAIINEDSVERMSPNEIRMRRNHVN